ncbi:uncharacterized protein LOC132696231 [Cylas formicarius]|uniref:uncharacterized protein LOC132696231 n=1 Tax=Cylas formicarius TaxID=197179 RepID=UPI002958480A|nr:uncharacterized protein LOC132696231 [Cylas formicarius]
MTSLRTQSQIPTGDNHIKIYSAVTLRHRKERDPTVRICIPRKLIMDSNSKTYGKTPCDPIGNRRSSPRNTSVKLVTGYRRVGDQASYRKYATGKRKSKPTMHRICTWNVQGMNKIGKLAIIEKTLTNVPITGISETHWKNSGHYTTEYGNLLICSGNENHSSNGVAFLIHKNFKESILGYEAINDRIITLKVQAKPVNLNLMQIYAPTSTCPQNEIDNFYGILSNTITRMPNREPLIVLGDFNAKIGETKTDTHLRTVVGKYGIGERNERGQMLIEFCAENELYISNSHFQHHIRKIYTWRSPDGHTRNQIDYVLIKRRWKSSIRDVKTYPGLDCGSDHNALVAEICLRLQRNKRRPPKTNPWYNGKNEIFQNAVKDNLDKISQEKINQMNSDELWTEMKHSIELAAESVKPDKNQPRKPWITQSTWEMISERNNLKIKGLQENEAQETYGELSKAINRRLRIDKNAYIASVCEDIEKHANQNQPRDLFQKVKMLSRTFQLQYLPIKNTTGVRLTTTPEIVERWRQYCENLMAAEEMDLPESLSLEARVREPQILRDEVETALKKLRDRKAPGSDNIVAEMLKCTGGKGITLLHQICQKTTLSQWLKTNKKCVYYYNESSNTLVRVPIWNACRHWPDCLAVWSAGVLNFVLFNNALTAYDPCLVAGSRRAMQG